MPELPEVEAVCRRLRDTLRSPYIKQASIERPAVTRPQTTALVTESCAGATIDNIERRGKNILFHLDSGKSLRIHLRMTGNLYVVPDARLRVHTVRAWFHMADGTGIVFDDPRALGKIHVHQPSELAELLLEIGPEPSQMSTAEFAARAARTRKPIKLFLMDQSQIAGLGNIYAAECLYRARIHPARAANSLSPARLAQLHAHAICVLAEGMDSAYQAYAAPGRFPEGETFPVAVYDREGEPCANCAKKIRRIPQGGRSTYFCPGCQRR